MLSLSATFAPLGTCGVPAARLARGSQLQPSSSTSKVTSSPHARAVVCSASRRSGLRSAAGLGLRRWVLDAEIRFKGGGGGGGVSERHSTGSSGVWCVVRAGKRESVTRRSDRSPLSLKETTRMKAILEAPEAPSSDLADAGGELGGEGLDAADISALAAKVSQMAAAIEELDYAAPGEDLERSEQRSNGRGKNRLGETERGQGVSTGAKGADSAETSRRGSKKGTVTRGRSVGSRASRVGTRGRRVRSGGAGTTGSKTPKVVKRKAKVDNKKVPDSMKSYLKEIGTVNLLTSEQEVELAKKIQDLMYLEGVREQLEESEGREPTHMEWACSLQITEHELEHRLTLGKQAKNQMIQANLRLVVSIAKRYANKTMSFQDLIQEGCVGLIRGAEKFDFQRGYKFSTYAHWWIRQAVTRSISDQSRTIRLPVHLFEIISRMGKVERQLVMKLGREPTIEELADSLDMSVEKIKQIKKASLAPVSLNMTVGDDDKRTVEDTLVDTQSEHPDDVTAKVLLKEDLENVLNTLNPRERDVLRLRYGLDDGRVKTLEEIGNVFSVTRERIRQIEAKALRKLRQPSRNSILREYLPQVE